MALPVKPSAYPKWATTPGQDSYGVPFLTAPPDAKQQQGWLVEKQPVQYVNWFQNLVYQWIVALDGNNQAYGQEFDAIVTSGANLGTDIDLKTALARVSAGAKILVLESQNIDAPTGTLTIPQNDIEIVLKPAVAISKAAGGPASAFNIQGSNVRIKGGKITGFSGSSDVAVMISGERAKLSDIDFSLNTADVDDTTGNAVQSGCTPS